MDENKSNKDGAKLEAEPPPDLEAAAIALASCLTGRNVAGQYVDLPPGATHVSQYRALVVTLEAFARAAVHDARLRGTLAPDQQLEGPWMSFCAFLVETHKTRQTLEYALRAEREEASVLREALDCAQKARDYAVAELTKARGIIDNLRALDGEPLRDLQETAAMFAGADSWRALSSDYQHLVLRAVDDLAGRALEVPSLAAHATAVHAAWRALVALAAFPVPAPPVDPRKLEAWRKRPADARAEVLEDLRRDPRGGSWPTQEAAADLLEMLQG